MRIRWARLWTAAFVAGAAAHALHGAALVAIPGPFAAFHDLPLTTPSQWMMLRLLGAIYLAVGLLSALGTTVSSADGRRALAGFFLALSGAELVAHGAMLAEGVINVQVVPALGISAGFLGVFAVLLRGQEACERRRARSRAG